ncbi:hypothetical protein [Burkholderia cenocepacia]|uniref:hypothetical protein n=1 Tax=Burkholderia cenocepacia TaxID=95486 RepID=UPI00190399F9|nr:hypothetical protein [Burkholderia cenocepacia]MBJ9695877.1 hypothetical protein [Burkholderia cenocepacia]
MDYTKSNSYSIADNGNRMHDDRKPVPTAVEDTDMNMVIWSLMQVIKAAALEGKSFDPASEETYSVFLNALKQLFPLREDMTGAVRYYAAAPAQRAEPVIYVPAFGLMEWLADRSYYRSLDCGQLVLSGSAARRGTVAADGSAKSKTDLRGLYDWAGENGLIVAAANWSPGVYAFCDIDANQFRLPDVRGEGLRLWDNGRGVDQARTLGSWQGGAIESHGHAANSSDAGAVGDRRTGPGGGHNHNNGIFSRLLRPPYVGSITGSDTTNSGDEQAVGGSDSADIAAVGDHDHLIPGVGPHRHDISISATGGNETRMRNVAVAALIKI